MLRKEQKNILGRRERDEERRIRFLNARTRIMGIDTQALSEQVNESRYAKELEKEEMRMESK